MSPSSPLCSVFQYNLLQMYVVMGGWGALYRDPLSSSEQMPVTGGNWTEGRTLPRPLAGLRLVTLNNILYLTG